MNHRIVLDIDGVMADFMWGLAMRMGAPDNPHVYALDEMYPHDSEEAMGFIRDPELYHTLPTIPGATRAVKWLREKGFEIVFVTARPQVPGMRRATQRWLDRNLRHGVANWLVMAESDEKPHVIYDLMPVFALDDSPDQVRRAEGLGIRALLFHQPYNAQESGFRRVYSWGHFKETLRKELF